ncbi:hypothetical protein PtB15_5B163 [Puccinia triticina]|nr:hypothetical protein PtB15_5B163 [Puccinia triticina]
MSGTRSQLPPLDPAPASGKPKRARRTKAQMIAHRAELARAKAEEARIKTHGVADRYKGKGGKKNAPRSRNPRRTSQPSKGATTQIGSAPPASQTTGSDANPPFVTEDYEHLFLPPAPRNPPGKWLLGINELPTIAITENPEEPHGLTMASTAGHPA